MKCPTVHAAELRLTRRRRNAPCGSSPIQKFADDIAPGRTFPTDELPPCRPPQLTPEGKTASGGGYNDPFAMLIPMLITLAVDLTLNARISWSWYPLISLTTCLFIVPDGSVRLQASAAADMGGCPDLLCRPAADVQPGTDSRHCRQGGEYPYLHSQVQAAIWPYPSRDARPEKAVISEPSF